MDKTNSLEEILDVVNEQDEIIGQAPRKVVHSEPLLLHREALIVVCGDDNKLLFQQRSRKKLQRPLVWTIGAAGHVPAGMDANRAAQKELEEELGINRELSFLGKELARGENNIRFVYKFICKLDEDEVNFNKDEIEQVKFFDQHELEEFFKTEEVLGSMSSKIASQYWAGEFDKITK